MVSPFVRSFASEIPQVRYTPFNVLSRARTSFPLTLLPDPPDAKNGTTCGYFQPFVTKISAFANKESVFEVRPFCWTGLTIRLMVMSSVLHRTHSVQFLLDPLLVVVAEIVFKLFQEVFDRVELLQI